MMLSCTACATRYVVDPIALGPAGRTVKCARCGHFWFQEPPPLELDINASDADEEAGAAVQPLSDDPEQRRSRAYLPSLPAERHQHPATVAGWLTLAALIGVLVAGLWAGRTQLVAAWPPAERLYKSVGITVAATPPGEGLQIQGLTSRVVFENEQRFLSIEGELVNVTDQLRPVPGIRINLLSETDEVLDQWPIGFDVRQLEPGARAAFNTRRVYADQVADRVEILFTSDRQAE